MPELRKRKRPQIESESGLFLTLSFGTSGAWNENLRPLFFPQVVRKLAWPFLAAGKKSGSEKDTNMRTVESESEEGRSWMGFGRRQAEISWQLLECLAHSQYLPAPRVMLEPKTTRPYVEAKTRDGHVMSQAKCKVQVHRFGKLKMMLMLMLTKSRGW